MPLLSIIIVNYKVRELLIRCLDCLYKASVGMEVEVFVVDNASGDDSEIYVRDNFPDAIYIASPINLGFAKANNLAIRRARGKYILLLNPDLFIEPDTLKKVCEFASSKPDFGALGVRMVDGSGAFLPESKRNRPSLWNSLCKFAGLTKAFPSSKIFASYYNVSLGEHDCGYTDVLAGAFMLLDKSRLGDNALLCEEYFMYGEDIDLSISVLDAGLRNYYCGSVTVLHLKGKSTNHRSKQIVEAFYGSMDIYYRRHSSNPLARAFVSLLVKIIIKLRS